MPNPYLLKHFPWLTPEEEVLLEAQLWVRAAGCYEEARMWREAAGCWVQAGEVGRASRLYEKAGDRRQAARTLLDGGRYAEALAIYIAWEAALPGEEAAGRVEALLGQAACHQLGAGQGVEGLSRAAAQTAYRAARQWLASLTMGEGARGRESQQAWRTLAEYGLRVERYDLVQLGYERALAQVVTVVQRAGLLRAYIKAVRRYDDRILTRRLAEELAESEPLEAQPAWHAERDVIEGGGFREGVHDLLHFVTPEQQAAWERLAGIEEAPEVDEYLRSLAPEGMVYIPPGVFLMGCSDEEIDQVLADYEAAGAKNDPNILRPLLNSARGQFWLNLPGYYMDRTPVTNAQYRLFMDAGGYAERGYWTEAGWAWKGERSQPSYWESEGFNGDTQPVVGVSWYEAMAYARWAGKSLPSEPQWEKAAAWGPQFRRRRIYPWGDEWDPRRCNWDQDRPTPVGQYSPDGDSAYGLADMAGNVDEWCTTRWGQHAEQPEYPYPYQAEDGREELNGGDKMRRILRGGGWGKIEPQKVWQRCGFRFRDDPWLRDVNGGFRCMTPHAFSSSHAGS